MNEVEKAVQPEYGEHGLQQITSDNLYDSHSSPPAAAFAKAWVSMYSRIFVSLPFRTVMSKTQSSLNVLVVALIFPVATPTTKTRPPCATNSGGLGNVISISSAALRSTAATPAWPRCVPASGQSSPGMIHSTPSSTSASSACLSPLPIAAKKFFTTCTFSSLLIESLLSFVKCVRMNGTVRNHPSPPQSHNHKPITAAS